jgi:hypothetical protein
MGRHFHAHGITVNKTIQTVESAAAGGGFPALSFRGLA